MILIESVTSSRASSTVISNVNVLFDSLFQSPMTTLSEVTFNGLLAIAYISVVASFIAYLCYWIAVKNIGATNTGIAELGTPIFGVTLGYFFLSMSPSLWQIAGLVMISSGLYLIYNEKQVVYDQSWTNYWDWWVFRFI